MIDHLLGRPSAVWKRTQVVLVLVFWYWRLRAGNPQGPLPFRRLNRPLSRMTPWQVIVTVLTLLYGLRHWDTLLGLGAPEPLARLYSRGFYRSTWINTALDAGFATAAPIRWKWLRDIVSIAFSGYYLVYANEADEKLRKYRAVPTVEMMRVTWEKTTNPYIRLYTRKDRPNIAIRRKLLLPRPPGSKYTKPVPCWLLCTKSEVELARCKDLIFDIPGGGFIAMTPLHHEDRLLRWATKTGKPILSLDYSKAPEYPFPYALDECVDIYRLVHETKGRVLGMGRDVVDMVLTGDSACATLQRLTSLYIEQVSFNSGANLGAGMLITLIEAPQDSPLRALPMPISVVWIYPALDFNLTAWMPTSSLRLLRRDKSVAALPEGLLESKKHLDHRSPLAVINDRPLPSDSTRRGDDKSSHSRRNSLSRSFSKLPSMLVRAVTPMVEKRLEDVEESTFQLTTANASDDEDTEKADDNQLEINLRNRRRPVREKSIGERVLYHDGGKRLRRVKPNLTREEEEEGDSDNGEEGTQLAHQQVSTTKTGGEKTFGTRLTMSSRAGYFNDRIITPSMMRCMAICYVGPYSAPDLTKDYYISPISAPASVFARFPPLALFCGEKDPFVDDTVLVAGKIRAAKRARRAEAQRANGAGRNEFLRMSVPQVSDPFLDETEDDWVQMRIFEGWSHGFAQMASILPEVFPALDLMATFINSGFSKHDAKTRSIWKQTSPSSRVASPRPQLASSTKSNQLKTIGKKPSVDFDDVLSFTPRKRATTKSSDSGEGSPASGTTGSVVNQNSSTAPMVNITSGSVSFDNHESYSPPVSPMTLPDGHCHHENGSYVAPNLDPTSPRTPLLFTVSPSPLTPTLQSQPINSSTTVASTNGFNKKEGQIIDNHDDLFHRRREDAGYGINPIPKSSQLLFQQTSFQNDQEELERDDCSELVEKNEEKVLQVGTRKRQSHHGEGEEFFKGQYVGQDDLYERRRIDAAYGLPSKP